MKTRIDTDANYRAIFVDGMTLRFKLDNSKPFKSTKFPEIEDVAINDQCFANCPYCYTSATKNGTNFNNIVDKANLVWGSLSENDRPFQIAIGGAGESTIHPDWIEFVKFVYSLGITPNYTTNGMHLSEKILTTTNDYCGGVALSWHPHISKVFHKSIDLLKDVSKKLNIHIIIGEDESLNDFYRLYDNYNHIVDYFVLLPYQAVGRAKQINVEKTWKQLFSWIEKNSRENIALGALFYNFLLKNPMSLNIDIYEPEIFSGYRLFNDNFLTLYKSSYDVTEKTLIVFNPDHAIDIITNSSSELFVFENRTKYAVKKLVACTYPEYLSEYHELKSIKELDRSELTNYLSYAYEVYNDPEAVPNVFNVDGSEIYSNWDTINSERYWYGRYSDEGLELIRKKLKESRNLFFLFSIDQNPDWDYQEKLMEIGTRYHLG